LYSSRRQRSGARRGWCAERRTFAAADDDQAPSRDGRLLSVPQLAPFVTQSLELFVPALDERLLLTLPRRIDIRDVVAFVAAVSLTPRSRSWRRGRWR
jgi:hypothetical protein